ncbi:hypothetical protein Pla110_04570 [Polystyrenella longa]|uniref:Uncharacterized protein n=1 Tax=Polystyrenella longa TaxID=2528007 RepID=A0A518CHQ1_9PLAN|nr:hypothetical protein [Polystyrenella longa]QDU78753.1 hypothetical protein Pla110_04570 [Polystyrenella longa]
MTDLLVWVVADRETHRNVEKNEAAFAIVHEPEVGRISGSGYLPTYDDSLFPSVKLFHIAPETENLMCSISHLLGESKIR